MKKDMKIKRNVYGKKPMSSHFPPVEKNFRVEKILKM